MNITMKMTLAHVVQALKVKALYFSELYQTQPKTLKKLNKSQQISTNNAPERHT